MNNQLDKEDVAKMLLCSSFLEEHVYNAYENLANRITDRKISDLLHIIAYDSKKHSIILKLVSECIAKVDVNEFDCGKLLGASWKNIVDFAKAELNSVSRESDLLKLIKGMVALESFLGEEYMTSAHLVLTVMAAEEIGLTLSMIKNAINWIIEDEERHVKIIQTISNMIPNP